VTVAGPVGKKIFVTATGADINSIHIGCGKTGNYQ
jgi:hypothetical protein